MLIAVVPQYISKAVTMRSPGGLQISNTKGMPATWFQNHSRISEMKF